MTAWTKKNRFQTILQGEQADRPIVSGWHHFLDKEQSAEDLAEATIRFAQQYDWDWIKINPRATYLAEAFGNQYDYDDYRWVFPKQVRAVINHATDLKRIKEINVADAAPLQEQLEAVKKIRLGIPDTPIVQTVFSPLTILLFLAGNSSYVNQTMYGSESPVSFEELLQADRSSIHQALHAIAITMAQYVQELETAGVDGLFYAVTGTAHPELFDEAAFNEFSRPYDLIVLHAMQKGKRILHTCGSYAQPTRFDDYPVEGISWDTEAEGNPDLAVKMEKTKVAGVDHHLFTGDSVDKIKAQTEAALKQTKDEPFLLVPNCAVYVDATDDSLLALRQSVR